MQTLKTLPLPMILEMNATLQINEESNCIRLANNQISSQRKNEKIFNEKEHRKKPERS